MPPLDDRFVSCITGAAERGAKKIRVHTLLDGRDVDDGSSVKFVDQLQSDLQDVEKKYEGVDAKIASGGGRMRVTMDRYEVMEVRTYF